MVESRAGVELIKRLDSFPTWPWPFYYLIVIGLGYFFSLYDVLTLGVAAPIMGPQIGISATTLAAEGTILALIGYVIGAFTYSQIADKLGRRTGLTITLLSYSIGSLLTGISTIVLEVYVFRFITGIGIGAELCVAAAYLSELNPANVRGRYQSLATFFGFVGAGIGPFIGFLVIPAFSWGWRLFFIIGALGAFTIIPIRFLLPESPRWLVKKGRIEEARKVISKLEAFWIKKHGSLPPLPQVDITLASEDKPVPILNLLTDKRYSYRLIHAIVVFLLYYIFTYPFLALTTSLLAASGYTAVTSLFVTAMGGFGFALGAFLAFIFAESIQRKDLATILFVVEGLALIGISLLISVPEIIASYFIFATANTFLVTILYVYMAEIFPTRARATGGAFTDGLGHITPVFMIPAVVYLFATNGFTVAYSILGAVALITAVIMFFGIKTNKIILEHLAD